MNIQDILLIIIEISQTIRVNGKALNERYLHHVFSHLVQNKSDCLNLGNPIDKILLHPEWPTFKKGTRLSYGRYKKNKENNHYQLDENGTAGFIDFAIGKYKEPSIGIEFSLKYGWSNEEIVYDYMKMLDKRNPFKYIISYNIILRENSYLVKDKALKDLQNHMDNAITEARKRLGGCSINYDERTVYLINTEIDKESNTRHWLFDSKTHKFNIINDLRILL